MNYKIVTEKNTWERWAGRELGYVNVDHYSLIAVYTSGENEGQEIFGSGARVAKDDAKDKQYTVRFGSCNQDYEHMLIQKAVIDEAFKLAERLNK